MRARLTILFSVILAGVVSGALSPAVAQSDEKGVTSSVVYQGSGSSLGQTTVLTPSIGYNFNKHFAMDVGVPIYFTHPSLENLGNRTTWNNNFGDAYVDLRARFASPWGSYSSIVTGAGPTGSFERGFSTGRATVDWNNRFEKNYGRFTPFVEASIGNTLADRHYFTHPYRTFGFMSEFEGGTMFKISNMLSFGASLYDNLPEGTQKVYSQLNRRTQRGRPLQSNHARVYETAFVTTGDESLTRDNGYSGWVDVGGWHKLNFEVGYSRSVRYSLDRVSFMVSANTDNWLHKAMSAFNR